MSNSLGPQLLRCQISEGSRYSPGPGSRSAGIASISWPGPASRPRRLGHGRTNRARSPNQARISASVSGPTTRMGGVSVNAAASSSEYSRRGLPAKECNTLGVADLKRVLAELGEKVPESEPAKAGTETVASQEAPGATFTQQASKPLPSTPLPVGKMETVAVSAPRSPAMQTSTSTSSPLQTPPRPAAKNTRLFLLLGAGGVGLFLILAVVAGIFLVGNLLRPEAPLASSPNTPEATMTAIESALPVVVEVQFTSTPTSTPEPTSIPTDTPSPTSTFPPLYVQITNITKRGKNRLSIVTPPNTYLRLMHNLFGNINKNPSWLSAFY